MRTARTNGRHLPVAAAPVGRAACARRRRTPVRPVGRIPGTTPGTPPRPAHATRSHSLLLVAVASSGSGTTVGRGVVAAETYRWGTTLTPRQRRATRPCTAVGGHPAR